MSYKKNLTWRLNVLFSEAEYRFLHALICAFRPVTDTGHKLATRLQDVMGEKIDLMNEAQARRSRRAAC